MNILLKEAVPEQAQAIARLIMQAMNYDCCQYFAGPDHTLADFERVMTGLVRRTDTQYSYRNTIVAVEADADEGRPVGIMVSYDGGRLHELRRAFIEAARIHFAQDFSQMEDETGPGEFYLDSMAVEEAYRGRGIASRLLLDAVRKAQVLGLRAGLLVDQGNPSAERLYRRVGFVYKEDTAWGSHPMRHLVWGGV